MLCLTRQEFENAALALGFKPATLRQWKCRRKVPGDARNRADHLFRSTLRDHRRAKAAAQGFYDARAASREVH